MSVTSGNPLPCRRPHLQGPQTAGRDHERSGTEPRRRGRLRLLLLLLPAALLTACSEYTIETTVNPDGSGLRVERIEASENSDVNVSPETFQALMHTSREDGWSHSEEVDDEGEPIHVFRRRTTMQNLPDWASLTGKVRISGALSSAATRTRGYVHLDEVRFSNELHLSTAADSEGTTSFTFRETFSWDRAVDALIEFLMAELDAELANRFPDMRVGERGQIIGFARARMWIAVEDGLLTEDGDDNRLLGEAVLRTAEQGIKVIRMRYPDAEQELLERVLRDILIDSDDRLVRFLEEETPGLNLALNSEIVFRLNLPGRVTRSNAHKRDNGTLVWEFSPSDAFQGPIEVFAEAEMGPETGRSKR